MGMVPMDGRWLLLEWIENFNIIHFGNMRTSVHVNLMNAKGLKEQWQYKMKWQWEFVIETKVKMIKTLLFVYVYESKILDC